MNEKDIITNLLDKVPEYKLPYIVGYIQGLVADEALDDLFCERLAQKAAESTDPEDNELVSAEEAMRMCGVNPDEL